MPRRKANSMANTSVCAPTASGEVWPERNRPAFLGGIVSSRPGVSSTKRTAGTIRSVVVRLIFSTNVAMAQ